MGSAMTAAAVWKVCCCPCSCAAAVWESFCAPLGSRSVWAERLGVAVLGLGVGVAVGVCVWRWGEGGECHKRTQSTPVLRLLRTGAAVKGVVRSPRACWLGRAGPTTPPIVMPFKLGPRARAAQSYAPFSHRSFVCGPLLLRGVWCMMLQAWLLGPTPYADSGMTPVC
jgi:hypothetical protein